MILSQRIVALIAILPFLGLAACGGDGGSVIDPPSTVALVTVAPATVSLKAGDTEQLVATPRSSNGTALSGHTITWTSSKESVATVSPSGLVTAVDTGTATITATTEGKSGQATVTVGPPVGLVQVTPATASLAVGATVQLQATPRSASGVALPGREVTWSSTDNNVATVSTTGRVTAVALGEATIKATSEGVEGTATITVTNVAPPVDNTAPVLAGVTIAQDTLSPGDTAVVTLRVTDAGSGVQSVTANLTAPSGTHTVASIAYAPTAGTRADGEWVARFPMPADAESGDWKLNDILLTDVAGNIRLLNTSAITAAGFPTVVHVRP